MEPVDAPVPLACVKKGRPQVVAQALAQCGGGRQVALSLVGRGLGLCACRLRVVGVGCRPAPQFGRQRPGRFGKAPPLRRGDQCAGGPRQRSGRGLGAGITEAQAMPLRQAVRILAAVGHEAIPVGRCSLRGRAHDVRDELDLVALQQHRQGSGQQRAVGVVHLVETMNPVRLTGRTPRTLRPGACLQQAIGRQPAFGDRRHQQAAKGHQRGPAGLRRQAATEAVPTRDEGLGFMAVLTSWAAQYMCVL